MYPNLFPLHYTPSPAIHHFSISCIYDKLVGITQKVLLLISSYLHLGRTALVTYEQQIALAIDKDFLLEASPLRRLLLHVGTGEITMYQRRLARIERADNAQS